MAKDSGTKCSSCGNHGHNSRTCSEKFGMKLFGVRIMKHKGNDSMKKSYSMGNLNLQSHASAVGDETDRGYLSDGIGRSKRDVHERKKGIPWSEEEHRTFLEGLGRLGKGDWRGISKNFVLTRTPTQVASHAQKFFLRQASLNKKKRRSSLFDLAVKDPGQNSEGSPVVPVKQTNDVLPKVNNNSIQTPAQVASPGIDSLPATSVVASHGIPSFQRVPYMVGASNGNLSYSGANSFPTVSFIPVMNYSNQHYIYQAQPHNNFSTFTQVAPQSSFNQTFQVATPSASQPGLSNTELELRIAPPQAHERNKLSSQASNFGGAIGVI
ncbi:hypothetical protein GIB67_012454 [Kingdonia uniflora]|uniref:Uncharacterized protein n=1 Tax=Kingdonia uniflora TaxID=39325 RepID=A0A7J7MV56_9MAGN|nr:hypothetical protein GIB67_012454 [Kingdonia uniflora]